MNEPTLKILTGAVLVTVAVWALLSAAHRLAPRLFPVNRPSSAESWLRSGMFALAAIVLSTAMLGFLGALSTWGCLAIAAGLYGMARWQGSRSSRASGGDAVPAPGWGRVWIGGWPLALSLLLVAADVAVYLPASPAGWDAMTYHLYFPARWLQEGRLFHVPTVFSDNAAAFAPQNGALFFAWQMALSGRDALVNVSQAAALALVALSLYVICRRSGVSRQAAILAALTVVWLWPVRQLAWTANVDLLMLAFWSVALAWQVRDLDEPQGSAAGLAGLSAGLAAGTKTIGLPLMALTALPWLAGLAWRRRWRHLGVWLLAATAGGGWWFLRSAWLYGNPLFPLDVDLGLLRLPGAYDGAAVRAGEFHLETPVAVAAAVLREFGVGVCILMTVGIAALGVGALLRSRDRSRAALMVALAIAWAAFYVFYVPHNNQTRFLLPTLILALAGWARILDWTRQVLGGWAERGLWGLAIGAAGLAPPIWKGWETVGATLAAGGVDLGAWLSVAVLTAAMAGGAYAMSERSVSRGRRLWSLASGGMTVLLVAIAMLHAEASRPAFLARADFAAWRDGYLPFHGPSVLPGKLDPSPGEGLRIAYAGANVPYALMGDGWRHRVLYVNTRGSVGDGFYEFWERDPRVHEYHKPGLYRGQDDETVWLAHLEETGVEILVVFQMHWAERRYLWSSPGGFPIEQVWASRHPERFELLFASPVAEIYRLLPPGL